MQNFWILAEASAAGTPAASAPAATATETPAASTPPAAPVKEVAPQPLNDTGATTTTTTTSTQAPGSHAPAPGQEKTAPAGSGILQIVFIIVIFAVMYFMFIRGPKKQQQQQQEMIRSLQKNDRVRTVGGIIGTVIDVKDEYITLKIDETNNTKIRVVPGAISKNLAPDTKD
jgi:preprotein translocase subunit YajC